MSVPTRSSAFERMAIIRSRSWSFLAPSRTLTCQRPKSSARPTTAIPHHLRRNTICSIDPLVNIIDYMVNNLLPVRPDRLAWVARLVTVYVIVVAATVIALVILDAVASDQATDEAWGHALIVAVFAVLLPLRVRAARRGSHRACVAVGIIAVALLLVNVVEALIPGFFPLWMRVEMFGIAALMAVIAALIWSERS